MAMINDLEVEDYLRDSVSIDEIMELDENMRRISADIAYWNAKYAQAHRDHLIAKIDVDKTRALLYIEHREHLEMMKSKVTEAMINAKVETADEYIESRMTMVEADAERLRLKGVVEAVHAKKDMLQSIGAKLRIEMQGDPTTRALASDARAVSGS